MREDWVECELGEVFNIVSGNTPAELKVLTKDGYIPFFKVSDMNHAGNEIFMKSSNIFLNNVEIENLKIKLYPKDTVIFPKRGGAILTNKKRILINEAGFDLNLMGVLPSLYVVGFYTYYWFIKLDLSRIYDGSNVPQINNKNILPLIFPLAPIPIQRAIVSKIEALFSDLDNGIANFKKAQAQLKIYRQAVLKKAFEGELTKVWREQQSNLPTAEELLKQIKEARQNNSSDNLPNGWEVKMISDVADTFGGYAFKSGDLKEKGNYQVIRIGNIRPGILRYNESPVFISEVIGNVLEKALLKVNDIIITQTGTKGKRDYGFTVLINKDNLLLNQRIAAIRCKEKCLPKYLLYFTWTDKFKNQFFENETGNVGQGNVGMKAVTNTLIDVPSTEEQTQILQEIERRLSVCDKMEQSITESIAKAEALRQSILKKAFEGKLLSPAEIDLCKQEADYEPASVLLGKIKAEQLAKKEAQHKQTFKKKSKQ